MKLSSYPSIKLKSSSSQQLFLARSNSPQAASQLQAGRAWAGGGGWGTIKAVRALALPEGMQENESILSATTTPTTTTTITTTTTTTTTQGPSLIVPP